MGEAVEFVKGGDDAPEFRKTRFVSELSPFVEQRGEGGHRIWGSFYTTLERVMNGIGRRNCFGEAKEGTSPRKVTPPEASQMWAEKMIHACSKPSRHTPLPS